MLNLPPLTASMPAPALLPNPIGQGTPTCAVSISLSVAAPVASAPEPGTEPNLHLMDCERCGEPMYHLFRLEAEYPLCLWWAFKCGECGRRLNGWEDKPSPWHTATYVDGYAVD